MVGVEQKADAAQLRSALLCLRDGSGRCRFCTGREAVVCIETIRDDARERACAREEGAGGRGRAGFLAVLLCRDAIPNFEAGTQVPNPLVNLGPLLDAKLEWALPTIQA